MSEQQQAQQVNKLNINDVFQALGTAMTDAHLANLARTEATVGSLQQSLKAKDKEIDALREEIESINKQKDDANERCEEKNKEILKLERENCKMREDFDNYFKTQRALSNLPESSTD